MLKINLILFIIFSVTRGLAQIGGTWELYKVQYKNNSLLNQIPKSVVLINFINNSLAQIFESNALQSASHLPDSLRFKGTYSYKINDTFIEFLDSGNKIIFRGEYFTNKQNTILFLVENTGRIFSFNFNNKCLLPKFKDTGQKGITFFNLLKTNDSGTAMAKALYLMNTKNNKIIKLKKRCTITYTNKYNQTKEIKVYLKDYDFATASFVTSIYKTQTNNRVSYSPGFKIPQKEITSISVPIPAANTLKSASGLTILSSCVAFNYAIFSSLANYVNFVCKSGKQISDTAINNAIFAGTLLGGSSVVLYGLSFYKIPAVNAGKMSSKWEWVTINTPIKFEKRYHFEIN